MVEPISHDEARKFAGARRVDSLIPADVIEAGRVFVNDGQFLPGHSNLAIDVGSSDRPPAEKGAFSIRVITEATDINNIRRAKVLFVGCMDRRMHDLYNKILKEGKYRPEDIVIITVAGGIVQRNIDGARRDDAILRMMHFVADEANLEQVIVSGHTSDPKVEGSSPCGGITFLNGGIPISRTLSVERAREFQERHGIDLATASDHDLELAATADLVSRHGADFSRARASKSKGRPRVRAWVCVPDDTAGTIRVHEEPLDANRPRLDEI